jgi:hypothetical protein
MIGKKPEFGWRRLFFALSVLLLSPGSLFAQFNGDFTIERYFLNSENFLDWKAYQPSIPWRYEWYFAPNGFRLTVGSISMYRFYNTHEIRLETAIGRNLIVLYEQHEDAFYGPDPIDRQAELRFGRKIAGSIIGFPEHDKKLTQMGYAFSWGKRRDRSYVQVSYLEQYSLYNEKNANTDNNVRDRLYERLPVMTRLDLQHFWNDRLFLKLDHRHVDRAVMRVDEPAQQQTYQGADTQLTIDWHGRNGWIVGITARSKTDDRSHEPDTASAVTPDLSQQLALRWADAYLMMPFRRNDLLTVGLMDSLFENRIDSALPEQRYWFRLTTQQLYGFWERVRSDWFRWVFSAQVGQARLNRSFLGQTEAPLIEPIESKFGVGFVMAEAERYRFYVNTTWSPDRLDEKQWDGGNVQVQFLF